MSTQAFPFPSDSYYFEKPWTLDDVTYQLTFRFNLRIQTWFLDIADVSGAPLLAGVALRTSRDLLGQYATLALPKGLLFVFDSTGNGQDPGQDDFSLTHSLLYVSKN